MNTLDYLITAQGVVERGLFYNYIHSLGYKDDTYTREDMINSAYPFAICIKKKKVFILESATQCFFMTKNNKIKNLDEIKTIFSLE